MQVPRVGLGASRTLASCQTAWLGLARLYHEPEKGAWPELVQSSVLLGATCEPSIYVSLTGGAARASSALDQGGDAARRSREMSSVPK
jgi:hypothetical protein